MVLDQWQRDMLHVYEHGPDEDVTVGQKKCREFYLSDPKAFHKEISALNRQQQVRRKGKVGRPAKVKVDEDLGTERCLALIERLLDEFEEEERVQSGAVVQAGAQRAQGKS